jgi:glycosyltransferase involved in cell wall biosynthesis
MIFANAPWAPSGYGTQAAQLGRTLRRHGHEVAFANYFGLAGAPTGWEGFTVYPGSGEDLYARDVLPGHYRHFGADLLITLLDIWVFEPAQLAGMNVAHWMPVDCAPLSAMDRKTLAGGGRPVAFSRFGHRVLTDAGYDALYAPHALDMDAWSPLEDLDKAREMLGFTDKFVIGINAANQDPDRKGYWEQLAAFKTFSERHDDALMLIHTRANTQHGVDIGAMVEQLGLQGKAVPGDQYAIAAGMVTEGSMVSWHGVMDVLSNCSWGEGFGLPILQSQACAVPVVVTDYSAMSELCGAGWKVKGQEKWNRGHNARWMVPSIPAITAAYEKAYLHARDPALREKARRFAVRYDADRVYEKFWAPVLDELGGKTTRRRRPAGPRRVWSPVMYRGEADMLAMRFAETEGLVDRHVLSEAAVTHRGVAKPLYWPAAGKRFARYARNVDYVEAQLPQVPEPWVLEHAQRDAAWPLIDAQADDDDIVLICDVDEIPAPSLLEKARAGKLPQVCSVRMRTFIHAVDWEVPQEVLPPTCVIATAGYIRKNGGSLAAIRDRRDQYPEIPDGGWHFSWQGGPEAAREKLLTMTCHTELLTNGEGDLIADGTRYRTSENGGGLPVVPVDVDQTWPAWIREHRCPVAWFRPREDAAVPV